MDFYKKNSISDLDKKFHEKRTAFMILENKLAFLENSEMSHYIWAKTLGISDLEFENIVRGYYMDGRIVFYKRNFIYDEECIQKAKQFSLEIKEFVKETKVDVWCGQKVGKLNEEWPPDLFIETI